MKQRIIVVVGPDMCGKTEIAKALASELKLPYFKASSEHETYLRHSDRFLQQLRYADPRLIDFLRQTGYGVVVDRAWPCEFAYSRVFGRETDADMLRHVDEEMAQLDAFVIICHRTSYAGIVDDIDASITEDRLIELDQTYQEFALWTKCNNMLLNVDDENLTRELSDIMKCIRKQ
jgi:hypothetical protein